MFTLFRLIILRNWRSIALLFAVILFASTGFVTIRSLTDNIETSVAKETRPLFWADLRISHEWLAPAPLIDTFALYLSGYTYNWGEIREFSTTLSSTDGKPWLVNVIAYTGDYPQKWILETTQVATGSLGRISVSDDLWNKYLSGWKVTIDGRDILVTDRITRSSDLGFSFANENALIILPQSLLSGSLLISSGSRLDQDLLISLSRERDASEIKASIPAEAYRDYRIRTYSDQSEQTLDVAKELSDYILLILFVSFIFAGVVMRSAHDRLFASLERTQRIIEILGCTRRRQILLFALLYIIILPLAFVCSVGVSWFLISLIATLPGAEGFQFSLWVLPFSFLLLLLLVFIAFFPAWQTRYSLSIAISYIFPISRFRWSGQMISFDLVSFLTFLLPIWLCIFLILRDFFLSSLITVWGFTLLGILFFLLRFLYRGIFWSFAVFRAWHFVFYDALRTHIRPLSVSLPITLSLVMMTSVCIVFLLFSFSFRSELLSDTRTSANIYAINILEQDRVKVEQYLSWSGEMYSILRARIRSINGKTLEEHFGVERASGEFTREYNITTSPLTNRILKGKDTLGPDEISMDDDFAERLWVDIWDRIVFLLSGREVSLVIANIRESKRDGFRPFFYFSFQKEAFANAPKTYFVSAYTDNVDLWKRGIIANSGSHVTFVDIENILSIVRDIAGKILSVITLFLSIVSLFALWAIIALFGSMEGVESLKTRLYPLFGMIPWEIRKTLSFTRVSIFFLSYFLSLIIWFSLYGYIASCSAFLDMTPLSLVIVGLSALGAYIVLALVIRPKRV